MVVYNHIQGNTRKRKENEKMKATSEDFKFFIETMINAAQNKPTIISDKEKQQLTAVIKELLKQGG